MTASTTPAPQRIYRINKAAELLGISRATTYRLIKVGKLVMVKISQRASGVTAESLEKHMSSQALQNAR